MSPDPRACGEKCPNCGSDRFYKPWAVGGYFEWDCYECGLEVPRSTDIDGTDILKMRESKALRPVLRGLLPHIQFGEIQE